MCMLERIMYSRQYRYLTKNSLLYCKQFGFQKRYSPEHAILQVVEQINQSFEKTNLLLVCLLIYPKRSTQLTIKFY